MSNRERIESLLVAWQEARDAGRELSAAELCRECPELRDEVERHLGALRLVATAPAPPSGGAIESTAFTPPAPPIDIGDYRVVGLLGAGGMGQVLAAEDKRLNRHVAIKVMLPAQADDAQAKERFLREARAAAAIRHDNVVEIYQVGEHDGRPFIVMPLLRGETLEARLTREGALPVAEVLRIGREAALGLQAAHTARLIHRDIKPANLWLEEPLGRVKVLDFGLARPWEGAGVLTQSGAVLGTPGYMAPEQVNGLAVDARSDLFSLGCVLYRAATGRPAFSGATLTALLLAVAEHQPAPPHEVQLGLPGGVSAVIMRLLAKRPEERPATAGEAAEQLRALDVGVSTGDGPERVPPADARKGRPRLALSVRARALGCGAALTVTMTALLVTFGLGLWDEPPRPSPGPNGAKGSGSRPPPPDYRGAIHVLVEREIDPGVRRMLRLDDPRALPLRPEDKFRIEATVQPAAYLYLIWVDPGKKITPVYPWDPEKGWGSRPAKESPTEKVSRPAGVADRYTAPDRKAGVATMVVLARPTPLDVGDDVVKGWFEALPELELPKGGERGAVWFDNYAEVTGGGARPRTFAVVRTADPFAAWQGRLQKAVGDRAAFQTAVSFARTGGR